MSGASYPDSTANKLSERAVTGFFGSKGAEFESILDKIRESEKSLKELGHLAHMERELSCIL